MTWKDAVIEILQKNVRNNEYVPMHYKDITDAILNEGLKNSDGRTPSLTVNACLTTNPNLFIGLGGGLYTLSDEGKKYRIENGRSQLNNVQRDVQDDNLLKASVEDIENGKIIKHYGIFWNRDNINWNERPLKLLGVDSSTGSLPIDFRKMRGVYLLYDFREVVYVGQAMGDSSIANRLKDHTRDRHASRWNRFSWFGIDKVDSDTGDIIPTQDNISIHLSNLMDALEGLLIEGIEPRQNRKGGNNFGNEYYQYVSDEE